MTDKEMFVKVMDKAIQTWKSFEKLENVLGGIVIEGDLKASFSFSETICAYLLFKNKPTPEEFYEDFWDFIYDGEVAWRRYGKWVTISTPLQFYEHWKEIRDE